ncbi:nucleotidyl transferase AbiEii/AbiGii toxin family protein [Shewanella sp. AS1]|uniref:nucleotidyl transferase AbiEii/AbiGii toxin family protein n=1 Tax=Shewanella sp. AS1 TaxID=2907626 RepID=UPI001F1F91F2|nr:nucleotidyl transferase AbiEii/AbiGii toxin family protein [Shewanella sp. AS1]MCE9679187.1 nucleotidyl transferase AbiEii/AbiGii toxin family protein [Shewanella sp. AS1]
MNNIYTLKHSLRPGFEPVLKLIVETTQKTGTPFFVAGATARDLVLFHVFGRDPGRQTRDIDTGILLPNWDVFKEVKKALIQTGLTEANNNAHRLIHSSGLPVDIIPFGTIADENGEIQWPPEHQITMSVAGFQEAYDASLLVDIGDGIIIKVASLAGLTLLKLIAWQERADMNDKDATDFLTILLEYQHLQLDRLWEDFIPAEALEYDLERQAAFLLGYDLNGILSQADSSTHTINQIKLVKADQDNRLLRSMLKNPSAHDTDKISLLLQDFWMGLKLNEL